MPDMRRQIDEYVNKTFKSRVPVDDVSEFYFPVLRYTPSLLHKVDIDLPEGDMVQELELAEVDTLSGAFSRYAQ